MNLRVIARFYEELNDYLPEPVRKRDVEFNFDGACSVGALIEKSQIPLSAVDLVLVNGEPALFTRMLSDQDRLSVFPVFETFDISVLTPLPGRPLRALRFVADRHLKTLSRHLRMLGFDTLIYEGADNSVLTSLVESGERILLTRSQELMDNPRITRGYLLKSSDSERQLFEVIERFDLAGMIKP